MILVSLPDFVIFITFLVPEPNMKSSCNAKMSKIAESTGSYAERWDGAASCCVASVRAIAVEVVVHYQKYQT